jgi:hypothetical protein
MVLTVNAFEDELRLGTAYSPVEIAGLILWATAGVLLLASASTIGRMVEADVPWDAFQAFAGVQALVGLAFWLAPRPHLLVTPTAVQLETRMFGRRTINLGALQSVLPGVEIHPRGGVILGPRNTRFGIGLSRRESQRLVALLESHGQAGVGAS